MKNLLFLLSSVTVCCIITGCTSVNFATPEHYTQEMALSVQQPVIMEFELSGGDLSADTTGNVQAKLAGLKKYKFFSKYNQGGHYVLRELDEVGALTLKSSSEKDDIRPDYFLQIRFNPDLTIEGGGGTVRNFIYSCNTSFTMQKAGKVVASGSDIARRGIVQKRFISKVSEGQSADDQSNRNDMIQKSFNRVLSQIFNVIPWSAVVVSGFDKSFVIKQGKDGVAVTKTPVIMVYKGNDTFIPVGRGFVSAVHEKTTNIEITDWADSDVSSAIANDINYVKNNQGKLFVISDKVEREFFNK